MCGDPLPKNACMFAWKVKKWNDLFKKCRCITKQEVTENTVSSQKTKPFGAFKYQEDDASCALRLPGMVWRLLLSVFKVEKNLSPWGLNKASVCLPARKMQEKCLDYVCLKLWEQNSLCVSMRARYISQLAQQRQGRKHKLKPNTKGAASGFTQKHSTFPN